MLAHLVWVVEVASSHPVKFFQFFTSLEQFRQIIRNRISGVFLLMHLHPIYTLLHTAKNQYRKFETKRNCLASVSISTFMCLWVIFIFPGSVCLFCCKKICDRLWEYIIRSQTHEWDNWDWGSAIPFWVYINGIFVAVHWPQLYHGDCVLCYKAGISHPRSAALYQDTRIGPEEHSTSRKISCK
jgi:hypothetical protein